MSRRRSPRPIEDDTNDTRVIDQAPPSMGRGASIDDLGPEGEAWVEAQHAALMAAGTPVSRRTLRDRLLWLWEHPSEPATESPQSVLTIRRVVSGVSRSVPVDRAVGELVAGRL
ncbi:hypothetical protein ATK74_1799 [Propionicimonas paludicola]|uniref:Uncharacterized protein n=1 Tax=Propionicimonas paludicola TaxID=185243 RepID=A0A2A9CSX9_9ACTN|nr:hypothetical protein ATK74_1799 [Propionicimonas paludicola]